MTMMLLLHVLGLVARVGWNHKFVTYFADLVCSQAGDFGKTTKT